MNDSRHNVVFVYGSLKRGYALHHHLESQKFLGYAVTRPWYRLFDLGQYPGLVEWPQGEFVNGELYSVSAECLAALDDVEGVSEVLYARRRIFLEPPSDGLNADAWFWLRSVRGLPDCGATWPASTHTGFPPARE